MLCRHVYNAAVGERRDAWRMRGISITYYQQKAELPGIKEAMREYGEVNAQVLQDVVLRVDRAFQAFFRRMQAGEKSGYPRFHSRTRYNSFTYPQVGEHGGARLDSGFLEPWGVSIGHAELTLRRPGLAVRDRSRSCAIAQRDLGCRDARGGPRTSRQGGTSSESVQCLARSESQGSGKSGGRSLGPT